MTYKDLSNFTYKELRFFTYADISLDKYELIAKAENQSIDLPEDIQKKLRSLCTELANHHPNQEPLFKNFSFPYLLLAIPALHYPAMRMQFM